MNDIASVVQVVFMIAFILMCIAFFCMIRTYFVSKSSFESIYEKDKNLYKQILGNREQSWIERRTNSIKDIGLWFKFYRMLYQGVELQEVVDKSIRSKFRVCINVMLAGYISSIFLAATVIVIGFILAKQ